MPTQQPTTKQPTTLPTSRQFIALTCRNGVTYNVPYTTITSVADHLDANCSAVTTSDGSKYVVRETTASLLRRLQQFSEQYSRTIVVQSPGGQLHHLAIRQIVAVTVPPATTGTTTGTTTTIHTAAGTYTTDRPLADILQALQTCE